MKSKRGKFNWFGLAASILLAQLAGIIGAFFTTPAVTGWYLTLNRPAVNPPSWLFAPVWLILYTLMGIAAYLVYVAVVKGDQVQYRGFGIIVYLVQLIFNTWWSILFFGQHRLGEAAVEILSLWVLILVTIIAFSRVRPLAAWLMVPYLAWVSFASYLSISYWLLN